MHRIARFILPTIVLALCASVSFGATHTVNQVGLTFVPDVLDIQAGDTVDFVWSTGVHTVTEGDNCTPSGFDFPLTAGNPLVSITFTEVGSVDYHCIPHCAAFDMVGVINVSRGLPASSPWGLIAAIVVLGAGGLFVLQRRRTTSH